MDLNELQALRIKELSELAQNLNINGGISGLNKQELIKQGPSNSSVKYLLPTKSNGQNIEMLFYPNFNNDTIFERYSEAAPLAVFFCIIISCPSQ